MTAASSSSSWCTGVAELTKSAGVGNGCGANGAASPRNTGTSLAADVVQHPQRVLCGVRDRQVAGDGGAAEQLDLRVQPGHHDRYGVVIAGVDIQDDPSHAEAPLATDAPLRTDASLFAGADSARIAADELAHVRAVDVAGVLIGVLEVAAHDDGVGFSSCAAQFSTVTPAPTTSG